MVSEARRCGIDFVRRRDSFRRAYDAQCLDPADAAGQDVVDINACGLELRRRYGFPDPDCPDGTPLAGLPQPRPADALMAQPPAGRASATD